MVSAHLRPGHGQIQHDCAREALVQEFQEDDGARPSRGKAEDASVFAGGAPEVPGRRSPRAVQEVLSGKHHHEDKR